MPEEPERRDREMLSIIRGGVRCARVTFNEFAYASERVDEHLFEDMKLQDKRTTEIEEAFTHLLNLLR